jgi:EAL domain-containing protein (putative c-di-GMP-specific phosphodiesterase class I)
MVAMADSLKFETVVEGVETEGQARRLRELGARQAQGYHYARPMPSDGLPQVIETLGLVGQRRLRAVADPT